jgi:hypothetical protein
MNIFRWQTHVYPKRISWRAASSSRHTFLISVWAKYYSLHVSTVQRYNTKCTKNSYSIIFFLKFLSTKKSLMFFKKSLMFFKKGLGFFKKGKAFFYFFPDQIHLFKSHKDRDLIASCKKNLYHLCHQLLNKFSPRITCIFFNKQLITQMTLFLLLVEEQMK